MHHLRENGGFLLSIPRRPDALHDEAFIIVRCNEYIFDGTFFTPNIITLANSIR